MRGQRTDHTLQPTALINEAFLKMVRVDDAGWEGRAHFLRVAASAMRSVLIDHARAEATQKRNEKRRPITLHEDLAADRSEAAQVLAVHEGIEALSAIDGQLANIVELRFFGGFSNKEIAKLLNVSLRKIERDWQFARTWLRQHFDEGPEQAT